MMGPLVSAILPCHNGEKYLQETLDSISGQSYKPIEIIAINNESTDSTSTILEKYQVQFLGRLKILNIRDEGVSISRNKGVEQARGQYIAFIDHDDLWEPSKIALQVRGLEETGRRISLTNAMIINEQGSIIKSFGAEFPHGNTNWFEEILFNPIVAISSVMMERKLFMDLGGFSPDLNMSEDYDLLLRALWSQEPDVIGHPLTRYRDHVRSNSYRNIKRMTREAALIMDMWRDGHPEIFRKNRWKYWKFRLKQNFLKVKTGMRGGWRGNE